MDTDGALPGAAPASVPSTGPSAGPSRDSARAAGEVRVVTPRGVGLAGTLTPPSARGSAPDGGAVLFVHGFLAERSSRGRVDRIGELYRAQGWATLAVDLSGCGLSDDDVVTVEHGVEDVRAASRFLADAGWPRQVVHAHSLGGLVALRACPPEAEAMVLTGPVTAPLDQPWEEILSRVQVDELAATGTTAVLDDGPSTREVLVISTQTLADFTGIDQAALFAAVACPVLIIHGGALVDGEEHPLLTRSRVGLPGLPPGSRVEVVPGAEHAMLGESDEVARRALAWLAEVGPG